MYEWGKVKKVLSNKIGLRVILEQCVTGITVVATLWDQTDSFKFSINICHAFDMDLCSIIIWSIDTEYHNIICLTSIEYCLRPMFTLASLESQTWFNIQLWNQMSSKIFDGRYPSSIYSWFLKPLSVLHSRFPTKKSWVVAYF